MKLNAREHDHHDGDVKTRLDASRGQHALVVSSALFRAGFQPFLDDDRQERTANMPLATSTDQDAVDHPDTTASGSTQVMHKGHGEPCATVPASAG